MQSANNDNLYCDCAVDNIGDVTSETIRNVIDLFRRKNNHGEVEDVQVVLVMHATADDIATLVEEFESETKTLKLDLLQDGKLIMTESIGKAHGGFIVEVCSQVRNYLKDRPHTFPGRPYSTMVHGMASDLQNVNPDVTISAKTIGGDPEGSSIVVIEVEHGNRSIPALRRYGLELFRRGHPYLRAFVGIKLTGNAIDGMSAVAVCYCKNGLEENSAVEITDAISFGNVPVSDTALRYWTSDMSDGLMPVNAAMLRVAPHEEAAAIEIPLRAFCYRVAGVEGNGSQFASVAGSRSLYMDLRECFAISIWR